MGDFAEGADQPSRQARPPRNNPRSFGRDEDRGGFGDRGERRGGGGGREMGPVRYPDNQQIFVGNLPYEIDENGLRQHFGGMWHLFIIVAFAVLARIVPIH